MSAKVGDIFDSNEITESLTPKRTRKANSKQSASTSVRSGSNVRRSSRCHNKKSKDDIPPKEMKLFPIFNSHCIVKKDNKVIKVSKRNETVFINKKSKKHEVLQMNNVDNKEKILSDKVRKEKMPKIRKNSFSKRSRIISIDCNDDNLAKLEHITNGLQSQSFKSERVIFCGSPKTDQETYEFVNDICLKTEEVIDCDDTMALNPNDPIIVGSFTPTVSLKSNLKSNDSNKHIGFHKKKKDQNGFVERNESIKSVTENEPDVSARRRSLRSGGIRNKCINYSEIHSDSKQGQKQKANKIVIKDFDSLDDECDVLDINANEYSKDSTDCFRTDSYKDKKGENVKEKLKLFPIFTSNKTMLDDSKRKCLLSTKRKIVNEEIFAENDGNSVNTFTKKHYHAAKRVRNETKIDESDTLNIISNIEHKSNNLVSDLCKNSNDKCKSLSSVTNKSVKSGDCNEISMEDKKLKNRNITESKVYREFDESSLSNPICVHLSDDEYTDKSNTLGNKCKVTIYKKLNQSYLENIPFPILSHVNVYSESDIVSKSDTITKFLIKDEISNSVIVLPEWKETVGLTDIHCIQKLKSKKSFESEKKSTSKCTYLLSDENENNESMLWTNSLQNDVVKEKNNEITVNEVKSWLLEWKNKSNKISETRKCDSDSESFSSGSDSDDDSVSNSIIISGVPGSGKTSLVFSLANELGFTVLEVNASSSRNGRNISHQLKESLESYHVESIKVENPFENNMIGAKRRKDHVLRIKDSRMNQTKNIKSFFEMGEKNQKRTASEKETRNIAALFQTSKYEGKFANSKQKTRQKRSDKSKLKKNIGEKNENFEIAEVNGGLKSDKNSYKISSLTIILFDDVDVVFEEDEGFWSTVKGFLKISKKPVIFTVSRNLSIVKNILNSDIKIFNMESTFKESTVKKIETYCKAYLRDNTTADLDLLTSLNANDLRRNILNAQFWTKNPKNMKEGKIFDINNCHRDLYKSIHFNSFIVGELDFSSDHFRKLLQIPYYFVNVISQYQSLGYDVLYNNLFCISNILDFMKCKKEWQTVSSQNSVTMNSKNFSNAQMWEEACEIFKLKKLALQNGSSSQELTIFADATENFSFTDILKGASYCKFQCISVAERIKMWSAGLPICSDLSMQSYEDIMQVVSFIHIYILRKIQSADYLKSDSSESNRLILEHPFLHFDQEFAYKTEEDLKSLSAVLPPSQQLNKAALTLDYLSMIKIMCQDEEHRQFNSSKRSGRFLHYFDSISFLLDKASILST